MESYYRLHKNYRSSKYPWVKLTNYFIYSVTREIIYYLLIFFLAQFIFYLRLEIKMMKYQKKIFNFT